MLLHLKRFTCAHIAILSCLAASPASADTLQDAVNAALNNHPQIERAKFRVHASDQEERAQLSGYFPEVAVGAAGGRIFGDNATTRGLTTSRGAAYSNYWEASISAQQPIFDGFETRSRVSAARAEKSSAKMTLQDVYEQVAFQTAQAYLNILQSNTALMMLSDQRTKVGDYLNRIKTNVDQGGADEAELQQANDVVAILDGFIADYNGQLAIAVSQYRELTGAKPSGSLKKPVIKDALIPSAPADAMQIAKQKHPTILSAGMLSESAQHQIKAEQGMLYPAINGELSYLESDKKEEIGGEIKDGKALLRMNWNFETGGAQISRIRQKKYEYQESQAREKELEHQIERDIEIAYAEHANAQTRLENNKRRYALNKKLFDTYNIQFDGGRISLLQLMQADNQFFNTKLETILGQYRVLSAKYAILASMGQLKNTVFNMAPAKIAKHEQETASTDQK